MNNVADDLYEAYSDGFADGYKQGMKDAQPEVMYYPQVDGITPSVIVQPERKTGRWENAGMNTYELSYGTTAYEPVYRCSACGSVTESYLRLDEPIMPEDAYFPNFCPNCGADMRNNPT